MPRWAKVVAIILGVLAVLVCAAVALFLRGPDPTEQQLGGGWVMLRENSWVIDSGTRPRHLQRVHGRSRTTVAEQPFPYSYLGDDCLLFVTEHDVKAACGDRPPILVARSKTFVEWEEVQSDPIRVDGKTISWADIKQHATQGRSFSESPD